MHGERTSQRWRVVLVLILPLSASAAGSRRWMSPRRPPKPETPPCGRGAEGVQDAPAGHEAWSKIIYYPSGGAVLLSLGSLGVRRPDGGRLRFQTTVGACAGSADPVAEAHRIARLCYVRFAEGASREEVDAFRKAQYEALQVPSGAPAHGGAAKRRGAPAPAGGAGAKRPRHPSGSGAREAARRELQAQGRLEGSLLLEGRAAKRKNASINGVYARCAEDFGGHRAYEKVVAAGSAPRFLYYWGERSRWKVDSKLGGDKSGFAYLKLAGASSPAEAGPDQYWHVYDDREQGYNKDPAVRCSEFAPEPHGAATSAAATGSRAAAARGAPSSDGSSDDGSNDDSDDSGDDSSSASDATPQAGPVVAVPAKGAQAVGAVRARACAKMMVRSGVRCACHFKLVRDCPDHASS
ncbi:unnamed protein product [Prorocentrum cordatum]|uniref:Uncharacterized protein n=1 Tax=Prorocentrum cordatum TaxID=2364126 RepID=A0ABN9UPC7_9DINO|nr:unnamed protein product [Polarella glacialis]